jgi:A/G-specific adenine glycosylase
LAEAPLKARWRRLPGVVEHAFTHFPLQQTVYVARVPVRTSAPAGMRWMSLADLHSEALPNVIRKVLAHAGIPATSAAVYSAGLTSRRSQ